MARRLTENLIEEYASDWMYLEDVTLEDESTDHYYYTAINNVGDKVEFRVSRKPDEFGWDVWTKECNGKWEYHDCIPRE